MIIYVKILVMNDSFYILVCKIIDKHLEKRLETHNLHIHSISTSNSHFPTLL
jgi:hypothetical protein